MSHLRRPSRTSAMVLVLLVAALALGSTAAFARPAMAGVQATADVPLSSMTASVSRSWSGFNQPLYFVAAPGDYGRAFVVEKGGRIKIVKAGGVVVSRPWLNISSLVSRGGEQGLLGLAFSPDYLTTGRFYVNYTNTSGDTVVRRYTTITPRSDTPTFTSDIILTRDQPYANHNGGCLQFGPDRMLYIGMGDGGGVGDPGNRAQNLNDRLGKLLRVDVGETTTAPNPPAGYVNPPDNPYYGQANRAWSIWSSGLRNPWRFSFDRTTGDVWIADVGQYRREEVDFLAAGERGVNFGWNRREGNLTYPGGNPAPASSTYRSPVTTQSHPTYESITGGYVYRGSAYPVMQGVYVYGDFLTGRIHFLRKGTTVTKRQMLNTTLMISSFGENASGELYLCDFKGGGIYRVRAQ